MRLLLIFTICNLIIGCNKNNEQRIIISGTLKDSDINIVKIKMGDSTLVDTIDKGVFQFEMNNCEIKYIDLNINGWIPLFVESNDRSYCKDILKIVTNWLLL